MLQKIKTFILTHKIITSIILIIIIWGVYFFFFKNKTSGETQYVTEIAQKGNITTTVTGTGQVEASDTINLNAKTSGDITYVGVKVGEVVKKGKLIASVDSRDAKIALENAKITLADLVGDPDSLTLLQKQNSLTKSYNDGWNTISSFVTDTNSIIDEIYAIYNSGFLGYQTTMKLSSSGKIKVSLAENNYYDVKKSIEEITKLYKSLSRSSSQKEIKDLINKSYESAKVLANTVKDTETVFDYVVNYLDYENNSDAITTKADINSWLSSSNSYVSSLLSTKNSIEENEQSFKDFIAGADELDIKSAELSVESKQNAYNDCFIYAPFDGTIATFTAKVGEPSGSSIGTIITTQKLAIISLNEVDIAKIKLGQKVTLTFDAIDELTITGKVAEIDSVGTVSQGVVSYSIKISFDIDDARIKPGMSVSATIITDIAQDVIVVPSSAVKNKNGVNYVETFDSALASAVVGAQGSPSINPPKQVEVEIGLVSDTSMEITSGLKEGDTIVTKTIAGTTTTTKSTTPSLLNAVAGGGPRD